MTSSQHHDDDQGWQTFDLWSEVYSINNHHDHDDPFIQSQHLMGAQKFNILEHRIRRVTQIRSQSSETLTSIMRYLQAASPSSGDLHLLFFLILKPVTTLLREPSIAIMCSAIAQLILRPSASNNSVSQQCISKRIHVALHVTMSFKNLRNADATGPHAWSTDVFDNEFGKMLLGLALLEQVKNNWIRIPQDGQAGESGL